MADVTGGVVVMTRGAGGAEIDGFLERGPRWTFGAGTGGMRSGGVGKWMTIMRELDEKGSRIGERVSLG